MGGPIVSPFSQHSMHSCCTAVPKPTERYGDAEQTACLGRPLGALARLGMQGSTSLVLLVVVGEPGRLDLVASCHLPEGRAVSFPTGDLEPGGLRQPARSLDSKQRDKNY